MDCPSSGTGGSIGPPLRPRPRREAEPLPGGSGEGTIPADDPRFPPVTNTPPISRGFRARSRPEGGGSRVPPGQHLVGDFPVLSAGPTPRIGLDAWTFALQEGGSLLGEVDVGGVRGAAADDGGGGHPLRDDVVEARHRVAGGVDRHAARGGRPGRAAGALRDGPLRRGLHDQPPGRGPRSAAGP